MVSKRKPSFAKRASPSLFGHSGLTGSPFSGIESAGRRTCFLRAFQRATIDLNLCNDAAALQ